MPSENRAPKAQPKAILSLLMLSLIASPWAGPAHAGNGGDRGGGNLTSQNLLREIRIYRLIILSQLPKLRTLSKLRGMDGLLESAFDRLEGALDPDSLPQLTTEITTQNLTLNGKPVDAISSPSEWSSLYQLDRMSRLTRCERLTMVFHESHILSGLERSMNLETSKILVSKLKLCDQIERAFDKDLERLPCHGAEGDTAPKGDGFVADTAHVDAASYVGPHAEVCGTAQVRSSVIDGNARVSGRSRVTHSRVEGHGIVSGTTQLYASRVEGWVSGAAKINNFSKVERGAQVWENAWLDHATAKEGSKVSGNVIVHSAEVPENTAVNGDVRIDPNHPLPPR